MPEHVRRRAFHRTRLLVHAWLPNRVAQCACEHANDGRVVTREVVQLDRLGDAVRLLRRLRSPREDMFVVSARVVEAEEGRALLDNAALLGDHTCQRE